MGSGEFGRNYWSKRTSMMYYKYIEFLVQAFAIDAKNIIDIGTANTEYIETFDWIPEKYTLDIQNPYKSPKVTSIEMDFLHFNPSKKFDFLTCLQVLEHIPNVEDFARKLLQTSDKVLISVPYLWPKGSEEGHVHDPVDLEKVNNWMGREPSYYIIVEEPLRNPKNGKSKRLICYYQPEEERLDFGAKLKNQKEITMNNGEGMMNLIEIINSNNEVLRSETKLLLLKEKYNNLLRSNNNHMYKIENYERELRVLNNRIQKDRKDRTYFQKEHQKILNSRAWKVMTPIRKLGDLIKLK